MEKLWTPDPCLIAEAVTGEGYAAVVSVRVCTYV